MPRLLASVQGLFGRLRPQAAGSTAQAEPQLDSSAAVGATSPPKNQPSRLAELSPETTRTTRIAFDNRLREVAQALNEHRVELQSVIDAYAVAEGDEMRRRVLARQYQYLESRGHQLEERHDDLILLLREWDAVALQQDKESWQHDNLQTLGATPDVATLHQMMIRSIAQSESWLEQVQATVDAVDFAADKARNRRDYNLQSTMTELDELVVRQRATAAAAQQVQLTGLAEGLEQMLDRPIGQRPVPAESFGGKS